MKITIIKKISRNNYFCEKGTKLNIDHEKNIILINQNKIGTKTYIINGSLDGTKVIFNGAGLSRNIIPPNYPIDNKDLSLINLNLKDIDVSANNSNCEDSVNFINSKGTVKKFQLQTLTAML